MKDAEDPVMSLFTSQTCEECSVLHKLTQDLPQETYHPLRERDANPASTVRCDEQQGRGRLGRFRAEQGTSLETPSRARASSCHPFSLSTRSLRCLLSLYGLLGPPHPASSAARPCIWACEAGNEQHQGCGGHSCPGHHGGCLPSVAATQRDSECAVELKAPEFL